jgi:hypothetical protein
MVSAVRRICTNFHASDSETRKRSFSRGSVWSAWGYRAPHISGDEATTCTLDAGVVPGTRAAQSGLRPRLVARPPERPEWPGRTPGVGAPADAGARARRPPHQSGCSHRLGALLGGPPGPGAACLRPGCMCRSARTAPRTAPPAPACGAPAESRHTPVRPGPGRPAACVSDRRRAWRSRLVAYKRGRPISSHSVQTEVLRSETLCHLREALTRDLQLITPTLHPLLAREAPSALPPAPAPCEPPTAARPLPRYGRPPGLQ